MTRKEIFDILDNAKSVFFTGIGGISMSSIAFVLSARGKNVAGSDRAENLLGFGQTVEDATREIYELIVEEPAHYLKYYVGYMEFVDLKEKAQETYGSAYSDIAFHKALLSIGPAPFSIIETYLDDYYLPDAAPQ